MLICYHGQQFHPVFHPLSMFGMKWNDGNQPVNLAVMGPALIRIWNNIPQAFFNKLVGSMRCRCQAYINANVAGRLDFSLS
jgi:hypothetical protein